MLAMDVNDDACCLDERFVWRLFASKPTQDRAIPVGASLLAMDVNDDACCPNDRAARTFFASKPAEHVNTTNPCGSGLAREGRPTVTTNLDNYSPSQ